MSRHHADWIKAYVETLTPKGEAPERFHYWVAVSTIGAALRRRVYLDMGTFKWIPNFYIVLVGPPGTVKKSTTLGVGASLLHDVPNVNVGADCSTWQSFVEEVGRAQDIFAQGDVEVHFSEEALLNQVNTVTCAVTLAISEFGTFFDPEDRQMVNVLTELYDGKSDIPWVKKTKTQGQDNIINPFVNIVAATTPAWMTDNFKGQFGGWGLSSRIIFMHADRPERYVPYPDEVWGAELKTWRQPFLDDLIEISQLKGVVQISPQVRAFWRKWYPAHGDRKQSIESHANHDPWLSYYLARKPDHINKLAMVLAISRGRMVILEEDMHEAVQRCDQVEEELGKIFASQATETRDGRLNNDVWRGIANGILRSGGRVHEQMTFTFASQFMDYRKSKDLIDLLVRTKRLVIFGEPGGPYHELGENHAGIEDLLPSREEALANNPLAVISQPRTH